MKEKRLHFFDYNATTPLTYTVMLAMFPYFTQKFGNPSSLHCAGQEAKAAVKKAREGLAQLLKITPSEIIFNGSGSEANNLAIKGLARSLKSRGKHLITSLGEHHSVLNTMREMENEGFEVTYIPLELSGKLRLDLLAKALRKDTILVSIMAVNNETGVIQPLSEISQLIKKHSSFFHTDAVQALGKIPLDLKGWGVDLASFSAHKIFGPKGVGMLYVKEGTPLWPIIHGGGQENKRRAGTENVSGIIGFKKAALNIIRNQERDWTKYKEERDWLENFLSEEFPQIIINGKETLRVSNTSNFIIPGIEGKKLVQVMNKEGFLLASGAACTSQSVEPSHVLLAMGVKPEIALGAVRVSIGHYTTLPEVRVLGKKLKEIINKLKPKK